MGRVSLQLGSLKGRKYTVYRSFPQKVEPWCALARSRSAANRLAFPRASWALVTSSGLIPGVRKKTSKYLSTLSSYLFSHFSIAIEHVPVKSTLTNQLESNLAKYRARETPFG